MKRKTPLIIEDNMTCPACNDDFVTKIEHEEEKIYNNNFLCLNCMTVFTEDKEIIERG